MMSFCTVSSHVWQTSDCVALWYWIVSTYKQSEDHGMVKHDVSSVLLPGNAEVWRRNITNESSVLRFKTLIALADFASRISRMPWGCVLYKAMVKYISTRISLWSGISIIFPVASLFKRRQFTTMRHPNLMSLVPHYFAHAWRIFINNYNRDS